MQLLSADTPIGRHLPSVSRQMTLRQFQERHETVYGPNVWPKNNLHADEEAARREGLDAPVAAAPTIFSLVTRMMMMTFEEGWIVGGAMSLKMIKPVYAGDFVTAKGFVSDKRAESAGVRLVCSVWVENAQGDKVVVGEASAIAHDRADPE